MDFLARKWATELPSCFTWVKLQQRKPLARLRESLITKPNSGWFEPPTHNALETSSASPSKVASKTLSSNANRTTRLHAKASNLMGSFVLNSGLCSILTLFIYHSSYIQIYIYIYIYILGMQFGSWAQKVKRSRPEEPNTMNL